MLSRVATAARRLACACACLAVLAGPAAPGPCPDLALVLAIDASGSVDDAEFALQTRGTAAALADARVRRAVRLRGDVRMAAVIWGDAAMPRQVLPFHRIGTAAEAGGFATRLATLPRRVSGNTDLGAGLAAALDLIEAGAGCALRAVINVSGDGRATLAHGRHGGPPLALARARAEAMGVTVNALAILDEEPDLAEWYAAHLVTGPDAFVMAIDGAGDIARAMAAKLEREIAPALVGTLGEPRGLRPH